MSRYEIGRLIGRGGMAEVYEARRHCDHGIIETLACKKLRSELADKPDMVRRFIQEAKLGISLGNNHPQPHLSVRSDRQQTGAALVDDGACNRL